MLDLVFPVSCLACGQRARLLCPACESTLAPAAPGPVPDGLDGLLAAFSYEGSGAALVAGMKYHGARSARARVAATMSELVGGQCIDLVTWAPTTPVHRRRRGFDPAEVLARPVARRLHVPVRRVLARRPGPTQTGRSRGERLGDPPRFVARASVAGTVLLVDDVVTTGGTLASAAAELHRAGARTVVGLAAARTP